MAINKGSKRQPTHVYVGVKKVRINVYLTRDEKDTLNQLATKQEISTSMLVVKLIQKELEKTPRLDLKIERGK